MVISLPLLILAFCCRSWLIEPSAVLLPKHFQSYGFLLSYKCNCVTPERKGRILASFWSSQTRVFLYFWTMILQESVVCENKSSMRKEKSFDDLASTDEQDFKGACSTMSSCHQPLSRYRQCVFYSLMRVEFSSDADSFISKYSRRYARIFS